MQHSNFRFYQDRETGDPLVFLTRYGEFSENEWQVADYYRYRVEMPKKFERKSIKIEEMR